MNCAINYPLKFPHNQQYNSRNYRYDNYYIGITYIMAHYYAQPGVLKNSR